MGAAVDKPANVEARTVLTTSFRWNSTCHAQSVAGLALCAVTGTASVEGWPVAAVYQRTDLRPPRPA